MRIIAVILIMSFILLPTIIASIFAICGKGGIVVDFIIGYSWNYSNSNKSNLEARKYILKVYGIQKIIISLIAFSSVSCFIYEQWVVGIVLIAIMFISFGIIELTLKLNKKYQKFKKELSNECLEIINETFEKKDELDDESQSTINK